MTFRGLEYQTVLDMQRCLLVAKADLKVLELQLKTYRLQRDKIGIDETEIKLNIQKNFIYKLDKTINDILDDIDLINESMGDIEAKVFQLKFIFGKPNYVITKELHIGDTTLYKILKNIDKHLNNDIGKSIKRALTE